MSKMVMMLVDDEERFLSTTSKLLSKKGIEPLTAISGQEALDKLEKEYVDVVILDVKMPGMDGVTALKHIKARYPLVEVIMLTGHGTIDSAVEGMKTGAYDYLTKPCDLDELMAKAEEAFARKQVMEEKIRMAQVRKAMASPREVVKETKGGR
jgi:DNA-binding NtrC family response regulator